MNRSPRQNADRFDVETYISVDVETAGPVPGEYSMLSLGASVVGRPDKTHYVELRPINQRFVAEALAISKFSLEQLAETGRDPREAMESLQRWVRDVAEGRRPVFVGFNASFDWQFVNWYFHVYVGENPFGIGAIDIKSYYMGLTGCLWKETTSRQLPPQFQPSHKQTHNALDDAVAQAQIFENLLAHSRRK